MASISLLRGSYRLFSGTSCKLFPRSAPPSSTATAEKWRKYIKNSEDEEIVHSASFGSVRLDTDQRPKSQEETSHNVASTFTKTENEPQEDNFFLEDSSTVTEAHVYERPSTTSAARQARPDKRLNETSPELSSSSLKVVAKPKQGPSKMKQEDSTTIKAYKYIEQLRAKSNAADALMRKNQSKELEVSKIGESLEMRMQKAMNVDTTNRAKDFSSSEITDQPLGIIRPKFLPINLEKLTSAEVIGILKDSVIYNQGEYILGSHGVNGDC